MADASFEAALDCLLELGVVEDGAEGLVTSADFETTRAIYRDSYADAGDAAFRQTVVETFDVDPETAADRIDSGELTREDLVSYLALQSHLDADCDRETLAAMATLVVEIGPGSPVPDAVTELADDEWETYLDAHPDAVVTVWTHDCAPCEALKGDLDEVLASLPEGVAVAGVDGESVPSFRRAFDVDAAPAVCCFRDGALVETVTGRQSPAAYAERFEAVY
ncbi:MAG: thioredoxin family protein [Haloplanus sp.]